ELPRQAQAVLVRNMLANTENAMNEKLSRLTELKQKWSSIAGQATRSKIAMSMNISSTLDPVERNYTEFLNFIKSDALKNKNWNEVKSAIELSVKDLEEQFSRVTARDQELRPPGNRS